MLFKHDNGYVIADIRQVKYLKIWYAYQRVVSSRDFYFLRKDGQWTLSIDEDCYFPSFNSLLETLLDYV